MAWMRIVFTHWRDAGQNNPDWDKHPRVGTSGFMRIDDDGAVALMDDHGEALPLGAAYCYEITDPASIGPTWPAQQLALANGAALDNRRIARLAKTNPIEALKKKEGWQ